MPGPPGTRENQIPCDQSAAEKRLRTVPGSEFLPTQYPEKEYRAVNKKPRVQRAEQLGNALPELEGEEQPGFSPISGFPRVSKSDQRLAKGRNSRPRRTEG